MNMYDLLNKNRSSSQYSPENTIRDLIKSELLLSLIDLQKLNFLESAITNGKAENFDIENEKEKIDLILENREKFLAKTGSTYETAQQYGEIAYTIAIHNYLRGKKLVKEAGSGEIFGATYKNESLLTYMADNNQENEDLSVKLNDLDNLRKQRHNFAANNNLYLQSLGPEGGKYYLYGEPINSWVHGNTVNFDEFRKQKFLITTKTQLDYAKDAYIKICKGDGSVVDASQLTLGEQEKLLLQFLMLVLPKKAGYIVEEYERKGIRNIKKAQYCEIFKIIFEEFDKLMST